MTREQPRKAAPQHQATLQRMTLWSQLSFYQRFERAVVYVLIALIAILMAMATLHLIVAITMLIWRDGWNVADPEVFRDIFARFFTVLIALEFEHSLFVSLETPRHIVQLRSVIVIAILALVRKFIILDVHSMTAGIVGALAGAILALGAVYRFVTQSGSSEAPASKT
jgi:uncharacterized membrane protein (DUF373 family)